VNPRWKIRRGTDGWWVYRINGHLTITIGVFTVWENALLYIDIQEANA
jgi:hypothetical protein